MSSLLHLNVSQHADVLSVQVLVSPRLFVTEIVSKQVVVHEPHTSSNWVESHRESAHDFHAGLQLHLVSNERESTDNHDSSEDGATETGLSMNFTELIGITEELRGILNSLAVLVTEAHAKLLLSLEECVHVVKRARLLSTEKVSLVSTTAEVTHLIFNYKL